MREELIPIFHVADARKTAAWYGRLEAVHLRGDRPLDVAITGFGTKAWERHGRIAT